MEYYVGLDVSLRSYAVPIVDAKGNVMLERELPCKISDIAEFLCQFQHPIERLGFKAGTMSQTSVRLQLASMSFSSAPPNSAQIEMLVLLCSCV